MLPQKSCDITSLLLKHHTSLFRRDDEQKEAEVHSRGGPIDSLSGCAKGDIELETDCTKYSRAYKPTSQRAVYELLGTQCITPAMD